MRGDLLLGPDWRSRGFRQTGWVLLPLRAFLGITFTVAALQKLGSRSFFDSHNPTSIYAQTRTFEHTSPIGPLVSIAAHHAGLFGVTIALAELAVGIATLLGLWTRAAAVLGAVLAFSFFLTVSWNTSPYYYGSDIVFLFAWTPFIAVGAAGVLALDTLVALKARQDLGLRPEAANVAVSSRRIREICPRGESCAIARDGRCGRLTKCPVFHADAPMRANTKEELSRRTLLRSGQVAAVLGGAALLLGGFSAVVGRALGSTTTKASPRRRTVPRAAGPSPAAPASGSAPGTAIGSASQVPVGQAASFTDPASGNPAYVVHPSDNTFVAFSAVCTHAGCTVQFDPSSMQFLCPCHGGAYDAKSGQVLGGPPPTPLPSIPVHVIGGEIRVD